MVSRRDREGKLAVWAGWLLGGLILLGLAVVAVTLSPDGARLRRLMVPQANENRDAALVQGAALEGGRGRAGAAFAGDGGGALAGGGAASGAAPSGAAFWDPTGCISAEVIGPTQGINVFIEGRWKGVVPVLIRGLDPGTHVLTFKMGDVSWEEEVGVTAGDTTIAACAAPNWAGAGQVVIRGSHAPSRAAGRIDSVLVDGLFVGSGELSVEVSPGYHSVSFGGKGAVRCDFVVFVPPGSVQYVSAPEQAPPFSIRGRSPTMEGDLYRFEAHVSRSIRPSPELSLLVLPREGASLKAAIMPRGSSDLVYAGAISAAELSSAAIVRYFYRATLASGEEIDSPIYTLRPSGG